MVSKNIAANICGRLWGVASAYVFIPIYIAYLGIEQYGLIGVHATLSAIISLADSGLSAAVTRELARGAARSCETRSIGTLVRTYEVLYIVISVSVAALVWMLAPLLASHWLNVGNMKQADAIDAIRIMGISAAAQLPASMFMGGLFGLQRQVQANAAQIGIGVIRGLGAIIVLEHVSCTIIAFFFWQGVSSISFACVVRRLLWQNIKADKSQNRFDWRAIADTYKYAFGMAGMAILSTGLFHVDKIIIAKIVELETFGYYTLVSSVAGVPRIFAVSIGTAVFPVIAAAVAAKNIDALDDWYIKTITAVSVLSIPIALVLSVTTENLVYAWTGYYPPKQTNDAAFYLLLGEALQVATVPAYFVSLAMGRVDLNLRCGVYSLLGFTLLLSVLIRTFGVVGAGYSWLIVQIFAAPWYIWQIHLASTELSLWRTYRSMAKAVIGCLPIVVTIGIWAPRWDGRLYSTLYCLGACGLCCLITVALSPQTVSLARELLSRRMVPANPSCK